MPLTSNPDAFYLSNEDFFDRFGFEKPRAADTASTSTSGGEAEGRKAATDGNPFTSRMKGREANSGLNADGVDSMEVNEEAGAASDGRAKGVEEVIFYCKAGVRSRAAATMAREWEGVKIGQYAEGWMGWEKKGGRVER
jgi:rhodanese-related sulfurtransferase